MAYNKFDPNLDYAGILNAIQEAIAAGADDWQEPEGWEPGDHDGCWEHPAAAEARRLTDGHSWEFTNWSGALYVWTERAATDE